MNLTPDQIAALVNPSFILKVLAMLIVGRVVVKWIDKWDGSVSKRDRYK